MLRALCSWRQPGRWLQIFSPAERSGDNLNAVVMSYRWGPLSCTTSLWSVGLGPSLESALTVFLEAELWRRKQQLRMKRHWKFIRALCEIGLQDTVLLGRKLFSPKGRILILAFCKLIDIAEARKSVERGHVNHALSAAWLCNDKAGMGQTNLKRKGVCGWSCFHSSQSSRNTG